jgi:hypothetical protein
MPPSIRRSDDRVSDRVGCRISLRNPRGFASCTSLVLRGTLRPCGVASCARWWGRLCHEIRSLRRRVRSVVGINDQSSSITWLLYWRRSPDWRWSVISNELRHQQSRVLKRRTSGAPKDGVLCAAGNVPIVTHRHRDLSSSVGIATAMAWGPRLKPLHPVVERFAAMLVPIALDGLVREVAGLSPLLGAVDEVVSVHATVGGDVQPAARAKAAAEETIKEMAKELAEEKMRNLVLMREMVKKEAFRRKKSAATKIQAAFRTKLNRCWLPGISVGRPFLSMATLVPVKAVAHSVVSD